MNSPDKSTLDVSRPEPCPLFLCEFEEITEDDNIGCVVGILIIAACMIGIAIICLA